MLASAILTVETGFLIALAIFLVLAVSTFVALEIRRSAAGAVSPPFRRGLADGAAIESRAGDHIGPGRRERAAASAA